MTLTLRQLRVSEMARRWDYAYSLWETGQALSPNVEDLALDAWEYLGERRLTRGEPAVVALGTLIYVLQELGWESQAIASAANDYIQEMK